MRKHWPRAAVLTLIGAITSMLVTVAAPSSAVQLNYDPQNLTALVNDGSLDVSWDEPLPGDYLQYLTGYEVFWADSADPSNFHSACKTDAVTRACNVPLPGGSSYSILVSTLFNVPDGTLVFGAAQTDPIAVDRGANSIPYAPVPQAVSAVPANGYATVSWQLPAGFNAAYVDSFTVTSNPGALTCSTDGALTCVIDGLTNGTSYTFTVVSTNIVGTSDPSAPSAAVTPSYVPAAPTGAVAERGNRQLVARWTSPADTGGLAITSYTATITPAPAIGSATCTVATTTCTFTGLTNGTSYTFTVVATNSIGDSVPSDPSAAVIPATFPGAPTNPSAAKGNKQATVLWSAPMDNGGSAVRNYTVTSSPGGYTCTTSTRSCVVTGLTNGTSYTFSVVATNSVGDSPASTSTASVTPLGPPGSPTEVAATVADASLQVSWSAPTDNGGSAITRYTATTSPGNKTCTAAITSCTISGLTNGTSYTVTVVATNAQGDSLPSTASAAKTPARVPGAPTGVTATAGAGGATTATVSWNAPLDSGGSPISSYTVTSSPGALTCTTATTSCVVSGLSYAVNYTFTVTATNGIGASPASSASAAVMLVTRPAAPASVVAAKGNKQAYISWLAPTFTGGTAITGYTVTSTPGAMTCTTTSLSCVISGLTNGTSYTFTVIAVNAQGSSPASAASAAVIPVAVSAPPMDVSAKLSGNAADVSWSAPSDNGGSSVTGYTATAWPGGRTCTTGLLICKFTGLSIGVSYVFTVVATTALGDSIPSVASQPVTPVALPAAPTSVTAVAGNTSALVSWSAPADTGGADISRYTVISSPGGRICMTSATSCVVSGLSNGTSYTFTVAATNVVGDSPKSDPSSAVVPNAPPSAPTKVTGLAGNASVLVSWVAPADTGGLPVDSYTVTSNPGGFTCTTANRSCIVTGLTNGRDYRFSVVAVNVAGTSVASSLSSFITPALAAVTHVPPTAPSSVQAFPSDTQAYVQWVASTSFDNLPLNAYTVTSSPGGFTCVTTDTACTVSGLTNGVSYSFTVVSATAAGDSPASAASARIVPTGYPIAPSFVSAVPLATSAKVSWTLPEDTGGLAITEYDVTASPGGATCVTSDLTCTITGLTNGVAYTFTVISVNDNGTSLESVASIAVTPRAVPAAPTNVTASGSAGTALVRWTAVTDDGGSNIFGYTVTSSPDGKTCSTKSTLCIVTGLTNGTSYTFTVVATNDLGDSLPSTVTAPVTPRSVPTAPTNVTAVGIVASASATITWTASANDGGSPLRGYVVTSTPGGLLCTSVSNSCVISGLALGTKYTFTVVARNSLGDSPASTASAVLMLGGLPAAPANVKVVSTKANTAQITFTAGPLNGGTLVRYEYRVSKDNGKTWSAWTKIGTATKVTATGFKKGTTYQIAVHTVSSIGQSPNAKVTFKATK